MGVALQLWQDRADLVQACLQSPFVQGLAMGNLPRSTFAYYVGQDAFFLESFARAYSVCAAKAATWEDLGVFHGLAGGVFAELQLHQDYARAWEVDLAAVQPGATTRRYADFLVATAWSQPVGVTLAAMAPCMRLYAYLGQSLAAAGIPAHAYGPWIETYSQPVFEALAQQLEGILDRLVNPALDPGILSIAQGAYDYAMQCEYDFFQAAWEVGA
jgi:thiaminase (transcriptional activator TenA)